MFTLYQRIYMNKRVYGNIGYANTYGILIILVLYMNAIRINNQFKNLMEYILITGLWYTGSRYSLLFLCVFIIFQTIVKFKKHNDNKIIINLILARGTYILCFNLGIMAVIFMPPLIYFGYYINDIFNTKNKKIFSLGLIIYSLYIFQIQKYF